jgi:hypothetical protein
LAEAAEHYTKYCETIDGKPVYRFASHPRFPHWIQNIAERDRVRAQSRVYFKKNEGEFNYTPEQLAVMTTSELTDLTSRMYRYSANITGSAAYMISKRQELEALISTKGPPNFFITCTMAENYWEDLHRQFSNSTPPTASTNLRDRMKFMRKNPHLAAAWFDIRMRLFVKKFLIEHLKTEWWWYRYEFQDRGAPHAHGAFRLSDDPGLVELGQKAYKGAVHARMLRARDAACATTPVTSDPCEFASRHHFVVSWEKLVEKMRTARWTRGTRREFEQIIDAGVAAERQIIEYHDKYITAMHPQPPSDARSAERDQQTKFNHERDGPHPCEKKLSDWLGNMESTDTHYIRQLDATMRHECRSTYCMKNGSCRFNLPAKLQAETFLKFHEKAVGHEIHGQVEAVPARNDGWLGSHIRPLFQVNQTTVILLEL